MNPKKIPAIYYSFESYNKAIRLITYWYQLKEILSVSPGTALEIGVGSGMVSSYLRSLRISLTTLDINEGLGADIVGDVRNLQKLVTEKYDVVLCARVLHHLPFDDFEMAVKELLAVARKRLIITLPVNDLRLYLIARYTSSRFFPLSLPLPLFLKRLISKFLGKEYGSGLWMLNDSRDRNISVVSRLLEENFRLTRFYRIPEEMSHAVFVFDLD